MSASLKTASLKRTEDSAGRSDAADEAVRAANRELEQRAGGAVATIIAILAEQRDRALREARGVQSQLQTQRDAMTVEQDRFIAFLMADHEKQLGELQKKLASARAEAERRLVLAPIVPVTSSDGDPELQRSLSAAEAKIASLQELLQAAYAEADDTRTDARRLQEERDEAIRRIDEARLEFAAETEAARAQASELEWQLDEANRKLADTRDEAREEAHRLVEELDEMRRKLDAKNQQLWQLGSRLSELDAAIETRPPPPGASELESARYEAQLLRKQLIDAKREHARLRDEIDGRTRRSVALTLPDSEDSEMPTPRPSMLYTR